MQILVPIGTIPNVGNSYQCANCGYVMVVKFGEKAPDGCPDCGCIFGVPQLTQGTIVLHYKGYSAKPEYSAEDYVFYGTVLEISDLVDFQAETVEDLEEAFHEAVDDYLEFCKEIGKESQPSYSE